MRIFQRTKNEILLFDRKRKGVLFDWNIKNSVPSMDNASKCDEIHICPEKGPTGHKCDEILINPTLSRCTEILISPTGHRWDEILINSNVGVDEKILTKPAASLSQYVMKMIVHNSQLPEVSEKPSVKRKALSPPGPNQILRAVKLQAAGIVDPALTLGSGLEW